MKTPSLRTSQKIVEEPTNRDILDALFVFSDKIDENFDNLRTELKGEIQSVRTEMEQGFTDVRKEIQDVRTEMKQGFTDVRTEMEQGFTDVRGEIRSIWKSLEEIKEDLKKLQKTTKEDSDAQGGSIVLLFQKIEKLEKRLKKLELQKVAR